MSARPPAPVAYVTMAFPLLSETFIINEVRSVLEAGVPVHLFSLRRPREPATHPEAAPLLARVTYLPFLLSWPLWRAVLYYASRRPGRLAALLLTAIAGTWRRPGVLLRTLAILPKSVLLADYVRRRGICHLHAHFANYPATAAWVAAELTGATFSFTAHAHDIFVDRSLLGRKLRRAAAAFPISEYNRALLAGVGGSGCCPLHVVRMGANLARFPFRPRPDHAVLRIAAVGRLDPMKGFHHLIEACGLLEQRHVPFECVIMGEGEQHRALAALVQRLGLAGRVTLGGWADSTQVAQLLAWGDVFALPCVAVPGGKQDGIPVALMEAMASGLPVVSTSLSGIPELVRAGAGRLVPPGDTAALAAALEELTHARVRARLARAGRRVVEADYDAAANARMMAEHLRYLAERSPLAEEGSRLPRRGAVAVLLYHRVEPQGGRPPAWPAADAVYTVGRADFARHLDLLQAAGFQTVLPEEVWRWSLGLGELPRRPVMISFDDGDPSHAQVAAPELEARGMRGAFFVTAGQAGGAWQELRRLAAAGHAVGSHGYTHRALTGLLPRELSQELVRARQVLAQGLGQPVEFVAAPHGATSRAVERAYRQAGYVGAFTSRPGAIRVGDSPFAWPRYPVRATTSDRRLLDCCTGGFPGAHLEKARAALLGRLRRALGERGYRRMRRRLLHHRGVA